MEFEINGEYTIFEISCMAWSVSRKIIITGKQNDRYTFKLKGKRKQFYLNISNTTAVFKGFNIPFYVDSDEENTINGSKKFHGNACLNFVGKKEDIKNWIDENNLNENLNKAVILAVEDVEKEVYSVVYPEIAKERLKTENHAVIESILRKQEQEVLI